jgi:hypothetical protein
MILFLEEKTKLVLLALLHFSPPVYWFACQKIYKINLHINIDSSVSIIKYRRKSYQLFKTSTNLVVSPENLYNSHILFKKGIDNFMDPLTNSSQPDEYDLLPFFVTVI